MWSGQSRESLRGFFVTAWRKHVDGQPLEPLERLIATVVAQHPEYHGELDGAGLDRDYAPEAGAGNPFLHMSMHIALQEQLAARRPEGIVALYRSLADRLGPHAAEHGMMDCLGEALWRAQRAGTPPDEAAYLDCLRALI
jgi:hypothetical protein